MLPIRHSHIVVDVIKQIALTAETLICEAEVLDTCLNLAHSLAELFFVLLALCFPYTQVLGDQKGKGNSVSKEDTPKRDDIRRYLKTLS